MLQCHKCYEQNEDEAMFCKRCGNAVSPFAIENGNRDQIVLTIIGFFLVFQPVFRWICYELFGYNDVIFYLICFISVISACIPLFIAIFIKNMGVKITLFIIGGLLILRSLYDLISGFMY